MKNPVYLYTHESPAANPLGVVYLAGRLPSHIRIEGTMYERYGKVGDYRYIQLPEGFCFDVPKEDATIY